MLTELDQYLAKIVWVPRPREEANVANFSIAAMCATETVLLHVGDTFHHKAYGEQYDTGNVAAGAKGRLGKLGDFGRVQDGDW